MRAGTLVRNETLKTTRRMAFWVALLSFAAITTLTVGQGLYWQLKHPGSTFTFTLPKVWASSLQGLGPLPGIFAAAAVVLLITSEFSWKTARQNVIDGLSKEEFFLGKLLMWPLVIATFIALMLMIVGGAGLYGMLHTHGVGPVARGTDLALMGGVLLAALGYSSIAYFAAFLSRSSGGGMGLFLLYVAFVEQFLGGVLGRAGEMGQTMARYLPRGVFDRLWRVAQYDLVARQQIVDRAVKAGRDAPHFMSTGTVVGVSLLWILVFVGLSFWVYRRRDL